MAKWVRVAHVSDCPPGSAIERLAEDRIVALFHVDGQIVALDGVCPHQGGPLGKGVLCGAVVTCPWHGWQFDVRSGRHQSNSHLSQPRYDVRVDGDEVMVDLETSRQR